MEIFKIWAIVGFIFLFAEMFFPAMFFLTLAAAAFFAGIAAFFAPDSLLVQGTAFCVASVFCLLAVRPFLLKKTHSKEQKTGIEGMYIGEKAQVIKAIGEEGTDGVGRIKIYGEVWQAKSVDGSLIELTSMVKIVRNESLIMYVEKIKE